MNKTSTTVIFLLVLLYLLGIGYLATRESTSDSVQREQKQHQFGQMVAPDGTVLKGPSQPPALAPIPQVQQDPKIQSTGPTSPPPQS